MKNLTRFFGRALTWLFVIVLLVVLLLTVALEINTTAWYTHLLETACTVMILLSVVLSFIYLFIGIIVFFVKAQKKEPKANFPVKRMLLRGLFGMAIAVFLLLLISMEIAFFSVPITPIIQIQPNALP